jgi:hypothetical protein
MEWDAYRKMMLGQISPFQAVAQRQPAAGRASPTGKSWAGAMDQAPRRRARDQSGSLTRVYADATNNYLKDAGLSEEDLQVISAVLEKYVDPGAADAENLKMPDEQQIRVGGPRGPVGAADRGRRLAHDEFDMHGRLRRNLAVAMPLDHSRGFTGRFPEAAKIRVL